MSRDELLEIKKAISLKLDLLTEDGRLTRTCKQKVMGSIADVLGDMDCCESGTQPFFLVWCENTTTVKYRHDKKESALTEAKRLAYNNPRRNFFVMKPIVKVHKDDVTVEEL